jgi:multiple sugar transport system substrate-binding protein
MLTMGVACGRTLVLNAYTSDPAPKAAFAEAIRQFEVEHPEVQVRFNVFDHEGFKTAIRNFLVATPPDVVTWFAGARMRAFVDRGLLEDVSDLWESLGLKEQMRSALPVLTLGGRQWGVPYAYYPWGIYYRRDLFEQLGLKAPATWDEFIEAGHKLNAAGIKPIAIGTRAPWTAAGWFDYLDLRLNGLEFHRQLVDVLVPYTDARVRGVFAKWRELVDAGFFIDNHASYSWQEAQPFLYQGRAAMYLIGNFIVPMFPENVAPQLDFFQFPRIDPGIGVYEDTPVNTLHIPSGATNKADARRFLAFMARPDVQGRLNAGLGTLPPNNRAAVPQDRFLRRGFAMLGEADGLAQFYDRDTEEEMARIGMQGFQEFMIRPDRLEAILERLERARQRIFAHP